MGIEVGYCDRHSQYNLLEWLRLCVPLVTLSPLISKRIAVRDLLFKCETFLVAESLLRERVTWLSVPRGKFSFKKGLVELLGQMVVLFLVF